MVGAQIGNISEIFYQRLFTALPDLGMNLFNRSNQANKTQQQALASSIANFATLLVTQQPSDIDKIMARIAAKHASLGVHSGYYSIIRDHLFAAMVDVFGDTFNYQVAQAWNEVYTLMANSLIEQESKLYAEAGVPEGEVWRYVVVADREYDGAHAATLFLQSVDGQRLPDFLPGQYISVRVPTEGGGEQIRQYTVSYGRAAGEWALSVKRVRGGIVSPILVDQIAAGDRLIVSHPFGSLVVEDRPNPLILISAGIGVTNSMSALQHLVAQRSVRQTTVIHIEDSAYEHVRRLEFSDLANALPNSDMYLRYTNFREDRGTPLAGIFLPADAEAYICGPVDFMRAIREELTQSGLSPEAVHFEAFAPGSWLGLE